MSQIKSIKCTNCAAPLNLLGGGRVESITCQYCKSVLDLNDNYKVLTNFKNIKEQHKLPFEIGMKGKLKGIEYTIIGRVTYSARDYPHGEWTDFLLFSAFYGYAFLTYEEGHLIYSKRNRTFPNFTWMETRQQSLLVLDNKDYKPFDEYDAKVVYVEGELTWIAKRNDKTSFIDLTAPPFGISVEKTKREIEYYDAEYLNASVVYEAFGVEEESKATSFHALQTFDRPFLKSLSHIAFIVLFIIALLFVLFNMDGSGKLIKNISTDNKAVKHVDFSVNSSQYLVDIKLQAPKAKELNNFNLQIHKENKIVFSLTPSSAYVFNTQNGQVQKKLQAWERNAKTVRVSLNLKKGDYHLSIKPIDMTVASTLSINIYEKRSRLNYVGWFFSLTLILWLSYKFFKWRYNKKRDEERGIYNYAHDNTDEWDESWGQKVINQIYWVALFIGILIFLDAFN